MRLRTSVVAATAVAAALALGACGTTEQAGAPGGAEPSGSAGPVIVTDGRGKAITLPKPATKVVGLEWGEIEMLVSLGVMPVGAADPAGYKTWVRSAPLDASVKDVGTRGEPSVDSIVALQPDLVVMEAERGAAIVEQLEQYVPVLVTVGSDASGNLDRMRKDLDMIATAVGKEAEADALLTEFDAKLAEGKKAIADAGQAGKGFVMADGWKEGSTVSIRMFGKGALLTEVGEQLGLANPWKGEVDPMWGLGQTDVEGVNALKTEDIRFFYNASDGADVFQDGLKGNAIWDALPFVKDGKLHRLPDGIWTFGGPKSCTQWIDAVVAAYTA